MSRPNKDYHGFSQNAMLGCPVRSGMQGGGGGGDTWQPLLQSPFLKFIIFRDRDGEVQPREAQIIARAIISIFSWENQGFYPRQGVVLMAWPRYHGACFQGGWASL